MRKSRKNQGKKSPLLSTSLPSRRSKEGAGPGVVNETHIQNISSSRLDLMYLGQDEFLEKTLSKVDDIGNYLKNNFTWINVIGISNYETTKKLGKLFNISSLTLEDIFTTDQRPKVENHDHYILVVVRLFFVDNSNAEIKSEQVSLVLGENFILSFQETNHNIFDPIKERIRRTSNRYEKWRGDFFLYSILDIIVDHYFTLTEFLNEGASGLENQLIYDNDPHIIEKIYQKKMDVVFMRRYIWPLRECVSNLGKLDSPFISDALAPYLKDLYDHTLQATEGLDSYKDLLALAADFSLSISNHRINEVMKFLTIFASIFIPLTFIVGIYGMNFANMPELKWRYGYHFIWGVMVTVTSSLVFYFRRKKWF